MTVISRAPKKAYFQASPYDPSRTLSCGGVARALKSMGYEVVLFPRNRLPARHKITPHTPVKGDTGVVKFLYERAFPGVTYPNFDVPKPLQRFARRKIRESTLGEFRAMNEEIPWLQRPPQFIKPKVAKLFCGRTTSYAARDLGHLPDDTQILLQDFRRFSFEYRFYVSPWTGPLPADDLYLRHTEKGTYEKILKCAKEMWETWKPESPKCYIMDVGMSAPHKGIEYSPTLVEINSVLTAGCFGDVKANTNHVGRLIETGWKSYARYAEHGVF